IHSKISVRPARRTFAQENPIYVYAIQRGTRCSQNHLLAIGHPEARLKTNKKIFFFVPSFWPDWSPGNKRRSELREALPRGQKQQASQNAGQFSDPPPKFRPHAKVRPRLQLVVICILIVKRHDIAE